MPTIRIKVPVLLYADLELPDHATYKEEFSVRGKRQVFQSLEYALGAVGEEPADCIIELPRFTDAQIYLTDHVTPVHSWDGLSLTRTRRRHAPCK